MTTALRLLLSLPLLLVAFAVTSAPVRAEESCAKSWLVSCSNHLWLCYSSCDCCGSNYCVQLYSTTALNLRYRHSSWDYKDPSGSASVPSIVYQQHRDNADHEVKVPGCGSCGGTEQAVPMRRLDLATGLSLQRSHYMDTQLPGSFGPNAGLNWDIWLQAFPDGVVASGRPTGQAGWQILVSQPMSDPIDFLVAVDPGRTTVFTDGNNKKSFYRNLRFYDAADQAVADPPKAVRAVLTQKDGSRFEFEIYDEAPGKTMGRLTRYVDRRGRSVLSQWKYQTTDPAMVNSARTKLTIRDRLTDSYGRTAVFSYDETQQYSAMWVVKRIDLPTGGALQYTYEMGADTTRTQIVGLKTVVHPDGAVSTFSRRIDDSLSCLAWSVVEPHDSPLSRVKEVFYSTNVWINPTNPNHKVSQIFGRSRAINNGLGQRTFETAMKVFPASDGSGDETRTYFLEGSRMRAVVHNLGDGLKATYFRDVVDGQPLFDPKQSWDGWTKEVTAVPGPQALGAAQSTDGDGNTVTYERDPQSDLPLAVHYPDGSTTTYAYNERLQIAHMADRLGRVTDSTYDANGNRLTETVAVGTPDAATRQWQYDVQDRLVREIDPLGNQTDYTYTTAGYLATITGPADSFGGNRPVTTFDYDAAGRRISVRDPAGRLTLTTWDACNRVVAVTYADMSTETWTYAASGADAGMLIAQTDRNGNRTTYTYDAAGRQIAVSRAAGTPVAVTDTTTYVAGHKDLVANRTMAGEMVEYGYDARLRRISETRHALSGATLTTTSAYSNGGNVDRVTDPYGRATAYLRDTNERVVRVVRELVPGVVPVTANLAALPRLDGANPAYTIEDTVFDAEGQVISSTDAAGTMTSFTYTARGQLASQTEAVGTPIAATTSFAYDLAGNRVTTTGPRSITAMTYTGRNLLATVTEAVGAPEAALVRSLTYTPTARTATETDALGRVTSFAYGTCCDRLTTITDTAGFQTKFTYDFVGNRRTMTDANGLTSLTTFDARNRQVSQTNAAGETTTMAYDDNLTDGVGIEAVPAVHAALAGLGFGLGSDGAAVAVTNPNGETAYEVTDGLGRAVLRLDPLGHVTRISHDTLVAGLVETAQSDALGHVTRVRTDGAGRVRVRIDALGNQTVAGYSAVGEELGQSDAGNVGWSAQYDARHRLLSCTSTRLDAPGTVSWSYDLDGNRVGETDQLGKTEISGYDLRNRRVLLIDRLGGKTRFGYDAVGNLTAISDAENELRGGLGNVTGTTQYAYDGRNLLVGEAFPNGQRGRTLRTYVYDAGRRLTGRRVGILSGTFGPIIAFTSGPEVTTYAYDSANRLTVRGYTDAANDSFGYDRAGRLVVARSDRYRNSVARSYDAAGRLATEQLALDAGVGLLGQYLVPALYPVRYAYDAANRTVAITYPDGSVAGRSYSDRNELAGVSYQGAGVASRHYDASGRLTTTTFGNGQTESRSYLSGSYLPAQVRTAAPTGAAATAFAYRYDAAERKLAEDDLTAPNASQAFAYDAAGRLVDWKRGATATQTWNLSLVGDWNSTTRDGVIEPRQNTWVHEAVRVGTSQLAYDAKGNLTRDEAGQIYAWDPENRLALAANLPGASTAWGIANYSYDALGRRVSKLVDGRRIDYAPAGAQVVQAVDVRAPVASVLEVASDGSAIAPYQTPRGGGILSSLPGRPVVRVNFQPATEQIPTGYLADKGRPLAWRTNGRRYGWSADTAGTARVRGMVADAAWDTNIEVGAQTWKIALPNGSYPVAIVAGDAGFTDSTNNLQVNGLALNDPDPATSQPGYTKGDFDGWLVQVVVTDGYLTIAAGAGAVQPKLCLIEVGARGASISTVTRDRLSTQVQQLTDQTAGSGIPPQQGVKKTYIYGSYVDEVLAFQTTSGIVTQRFYPHANSLYSVAALTNAAGQVVERFRFDAYGKMTITSPTGAVRAKSAVGWDRGFTGYVADNETGLLHARARQYSPTLGRYVGQNSFFGSVGWQYSPPRDDGQSTILQLLLVDSLDAISRYIDGYSLYLRNPIGVDPSGLPVSITLTTQFAEFAQAFTNPPGTVSVLGHGSAAGVISGDVPGPMPQMPLTPKELADVIRRSADYKKDGIVMLISCHTANGNYAQLLADELCMKVIAPDDYVAPRKDGTYATGIAPKFGTWKTFYPKLPCPCK